MSFFLMLAALLLSSFSIRAPPAAAAAAPPPPACSFPSLPSCPSSPPPSSWPTDVTTPIPSLISRQSPLHLSINVSSSSTLTLNFLDKLPRACPPSLNLTLTQPPHLFIALIFNFSFSHCYADTEQSSLLALCESQQPQSQTPISSSCTPSHSELEEGEHFNYAVSLTYVADSATIQVRMRVNYESGFELNQTFMVVNTAHHLHHPYANDARAIRDDSIVLFVDYDTRGKATINITTMNDTRGSKSKHISVVVWVVVGVSILALLVGFTILALCIKKKYYGRPPLINSRLIGRRDTILSSTTTRAPFPHHRLESQRSATPMMGAPPLSPPYNIDNFQLSGTASWLKQPNPR